MSTTAEQYGFGARARYAEPRASEYDMKEHARLSGLFPRVADEPMGKTLSALVKAFEKNAALGAILARRRALEGRSQYVLQSQQTMNAINQNLAPWARIGQAAAVQSAQVAQQIAAVPEVPKVVPDAAAVMTGGKYSFGGSESTASTRASTGISSKYGGQNRPPPQATLTGTLAKSAPPAPAKAGVSIRTNKKTQPGAIVPISKAQPLAKWKAPSAG